MTPTARPKRPAFLSADKSTLAYTIDIEAYCDQQDREVEAVRKANLDCVQHFEALKKDYATLTAQFSTARKALENLWQSVYALHTEAAPNSIIGKALKQSQQALSSTPIVITGVGEEP